MSYSLVNDHCAKGKNILYRGAPGDLKGGQLNSNDCLQTRKKYFIIIVYQYFKLLL